MALKWYTVKQTSHLSKNYYRLIVCTATSVFVIFEIHAVNIRLEAFSFNMAAKPKSGTPHTLHALPSDTSACIVCTLRFKLDFSR